MRPKASEVLTLGAALFGLLTSIAGSSACFYNSYRTNRINLSILKVRLNNLENLIDVVQQKLNGIDVLKPDPSPWLEQAKEFVTRLNIPDLEHRLNENCVNSPVTNLWHRCGAGRTIEIKIQELDELLQNGRHVSRETKIKGSKQPEVSILGTVREQIRQKMWDQVSRGDGAAIVCVHGVAGVGKTAVASVIHNQVLAELNDFETVIWVNVEYGSGLRHIQEELASKLHVDVSGDMDNVQRSKTLRSVLMQKGKFLLVLDSMWQAFSLHDIGIPEPFGSSKMIVTSRSFALCRKITTKYKSKEILEIKPLSENESWELFKGEVGANISHLDDETLHMAKLAVQDLDGLPLAIKILAEILGDMHDDHPSSIDAAWKEELLVLRSSTSFLGSRTQELLDCFKHSYENLGEISMSAFMYCALFPKGYSYLMNVRKLIEYWMWEGILGPITSIDETARYGRRILNEIKDAHLLENVHEAGREDSVKMLNVVRHVAADAIVKSGCRFFIQGGNNLSVLPLANTWPADTERASFVQNQLQDLRNFPTCKKLSSLLLQDNPSLNLIQPENFFSRMLGLKVLDLSRTNISSLPKSLSGLKNLQALLLRDCPNLKSIPSLSNLQKLLVLDLAGTLLEQVPDGLGYLTSLRRLDLSQTMVDIFPANIINKLTQVEELLLITADGGGYVWGSRQIVPQWPGVCVEELADLKRLAVLHITFLNAKVFSTYVAEMEQKRTLAPRKFRFCVGGLYTGIDDAGDNSVAVIGDFSIRLPDKTSVLHLLFYSQIVTSLKIEGCIRDLTVVDVSDFDELTYMFTAEMLGNLRSLKEIRVKRCKKMKGIIQPDEEGNACSITLPELMTLVLFDLPELKSIYQGEVLNCPSLRGVEVWDCDQLKLPEMLLGRNSGIIEIKGGKEWLETVKLQTPSSKSTFRFSVASVPDKLSSAPCFRIRRQESFVAEKTENQTQNRGIFGKSRYPDDCIRSVVIFTKLVSREGSLASLTGFKNTGRNRSDSQSVCSICSVLLHSDVSVCYEQCFTAF
ncbi:putative disease resistance protein At1g61300 [Silene latifolia]|uniref:putative disease resistance protein At1g61300 n=1 Tax=Silene latifolia TaxID=37657 RepID=UPI003D7868C7